MIEQIYMLTTIYEFQYIFPTCNLYTYTLIREESELETPKPAQPCENITLTRFQKMI